MKGWRKGQRWYIHESLTIFFLRLKWNKFALSEKLGNIEFNKFKIVLFNFDFFKLYKLLILY